MDLIFYLIIWAGSLIAVQVPEPDYGLFADQPDLVDPAPEGPGDSVVIAPPFDPVPTPADPVPADPGPSGPGPALSPAEKGYVAETAPPDRMTSAMEVRPILSVTKPQWLSVREYDGQDLLYFTNLLAWRCGLLEISYSVNGEPAQVLPMEPCYLDEGTPNAIKAGDILPYVTFPPGSVQTVHVEVIYDDLGTDSSDYSRAEIQSN